MRVGLRGLLAAAAATLAFIGAFYWIGDGRAGEGPRAPILAETNRLRAELWSMERLLLMPRTPTNYADRRPHASRAFRLWVRDHWRGLVRELRGVYEHRFRYGTWDRLAVCETGGNWRHYNSTYQGGLGFYHGSWDAYRPRGWPFDAHVASREEQIVVGELIYADVGWGAWPACSIRLGLR
jgi:hypothetical protein